MNPDSSVTVEGVQFSIISASTQNPSEYRGGVVKTPSPNDTFLVVIADVVSGEISSNERWIWFDLKVTDENGRSSGIWQVALEEDYGSGSRHMTWVFAVTKSSQSFIIHFPGQQAINLNPLLKPTDITRTPTTTDTPIPISTLSPTETFTPLHTLPILSTATLTMSPTSTPVPPTATWKKTGEPGSIQGVLINSASGRPLPSGTYFAYLGPETMLNEETCTVTGPGSMFVIALDANGAFTISTNQTGTFFLAFGGGPQNKCFIVRDKDGNKMPIELSSEYGIDLGQIIAPAK